ncbi:MULTISPECIES: SRPBCC domain-containing protein [unclassified Bradyrhizobium]|uniref:SRPBCC family protein n=1 Tax=unclassified Bradyrhizobium TaxID=2631580 RepID=UPI00041116C6|nr:MULTISPECIES: SRPBCC domain-containing protein [unclassified Bradyrhizobium]MCP3462079.1 SRPBCC domain-containing protein [Bradyrhizobium sp. CCGUVB23]
MSDAAKPDHADTDLVLEYDFDAPPEKVWRAVTIPALRERWLPDADLVGAEPESSVAGEEVRYRLRDSEPPFRESHVTFRIEPNEAGGTRFRIIQQSCDIRTNLPKPANTNCCLMRAAA